MLNRQLDIQDGSSEENRVHDIDLKSPVSSKY